jgi:hypothetical protein
MKTKKGANKPAYSEELATPIYEPVPDVDGDLSAIEAEAERRVFEQRVLKMEKLFDWYSIDPDDPDPGMVLAVKLALAHVPGMRVLQEPQKRRGRKRTWKDGLDRELLRDVDALRQTEKLNYEGAIEKLRKDKKKRWGSYTQANLIARHRDARTVEQHRQYLAEQLKTSPISQAMGAVFRVGPFSKTAKNSSDEN